MNDWRKIFFLIGLVIIFVTGCQTAEEKIGALSGNDDSEPVPSQEFAIEVEEEIKSMKEVESVHAVVFKDDIYVTLAVNGFDRFFLQEIRQRVHKKIKGLNKKANVHVSTDKKLIMELSELESMARKGTISKKKLRNRTKEIRRRYERIKTKTTSN